MNKNNDMKRLIRASKAWRVDLGRIEEGYMYSDTFCYAETRNDAKRLLLSDSRYMMLRCGGEVTYLTIPLCRAPDLDLYEFEGDKLTQDCIAQRLAKRERHHLYDSILNDETITHCYIKKNGAYYRPNSCGYTDHRHRAGVYPKTEAISEGKSVDELVIVPVVNAEHNAMLTEEIDNLKSRLL